MSTRAIRGARVWNGAGGFVPRTVWIRDGRIIEVTPPADHTPPGVDILDAPGRFVLPAFLDAHTHLLALANKELRIDLSATRSAEETVARLREAAGAGDDAVVGVDFDDSDWRDPALPTRAALDAVSTTRPVYARRVCGHVAVANTALLARLTSPRRFVDDATGRIVEDAVWEANRLVRPPAPQVVGAIDIAIARLHALGITAIHDIVDADSIDTYGEGLRLSRRPLRIDALLHVAARDYAAARDRLHTASGGRARAVGIKIFSDGSLGARTAALHAPYADADTTGELLVSKAELCAELAACAEQGVVCAIHAIGDRALRTVLQAAAAPASRGARVRIEHAELIGPEELDRCEALRIPLVMQPNFVRNWGGEDGLYAVRLGRERWSQMNRFASLIRRGVPFVFSSDAMPAGPLYGLRGATHHPVPGERIGAAEALVRYTVAAATLHGDTPPPALGPGAAADLVILSGDPVLADFNTLRVESTLAAGLEVHRATPAPGARSHSKRRV